MSTISLSKDKYTQLLKMSLVITGDISVFESYKKKLRQLSKGEKENFEDLLKVTKEVEVLHENVKLMDELAYFELISV